ncbi:MAG: dihydroorotate dehydrogenase electron transfer subunit [Syntrophales bacterium]|nr:dihydroorotate dehydrogenase electron transfer subunit [Syntrophales bacterium]
MSDVMSMVVGEIVLNRELVPRHFLMRVKLPASLAIPLPGQFVMVRIRGRIEPLLGRPLSIYAFERDKTALVIELLYRTMGKGTFALSRLKPGEDLEILGPLGHGFDIFPEIKKIVLLAGGIGVVPLSFLASHYRKLPTNDHRIIAYLGAKSADHIVGMDRLKETCTEIKISTDDGSSGYRGFVTELLAEDIESYLHGDSVIYACGPRAMMKRLAELLKDQDISCQVSVEERMACGVGACLGCAIHVKAGGDKTQYRCACQDGPVFDIRDIVWN